MKKQIRNNINSKNEYEQAKKELLASITHDLRTPLSSIKGYVEALQDGLAQDKETYDRYLNIINEKSKKLDHLIDDLFILSKMDLDDFSFNKEYINSELFLKNYLKVKQEEFKDSDIQLKVKKPLIAAIINIDSHRISQVLENLIENAKKFTKDYIEISTAIDENYLVINVEDNGIGIKPKDKENIFKLFYKIDKSRSNPDTSGSGIGLSICKRIMDAHNGKIDLTSNNNITVFKIFFPIHTEKH
jgi:signal transduction histidine kinase